MSLLYASSSLPKSKYWLQETAVFIRSQLLETAVMQSEKKYFKSSEEKIRFVFISNKDL